MGLGGRGGGGQNKQRKGVEIFIKFNKWEGVQNKQGVGISKNVLISIMNKKIDMNV